jgi:hypothetical protein
VLAQVAAAGGGVTLLSFQDGGYFARSWPPAALAFAAAAALAAVAAPGFRPSRAEVVAVVALGAFAGWQALSAIWSLEPVHSLREAERGLVYPAAMLAFLVVARGGGRWLLAGVLAGGAAVSAYSLGQRLVEGTTYDPTQSDLLNEPLGYANALGIVAGLALVTAVGLAVAFRSRRVLVALAAAAVVSATALELTSSRGSWLAAAIGAATAFLFLWTRSVRLRTAWLALQALLVAGVLASPLAVNPTALEHALSERPYYWWTAWNAVDDRPVAGSGAGTFDLIWSAGAPIPAYVLDAHSLYLETLVELGPLGLALVLGALLVPVVTAVRTRTPVAAVAAGAYVAFLFHAGVDWDWEMPAVTVAGLACGAAILAEWKETASSGLARRHTE